jgi:TetR/AcrR family transcriptional regulator, transcriptional repressor for nem operon
MIVSIADLLPKAPSARDEAVDMACRMLGALVLARAMPASSSLGRELLATATERFAEKRDDLKQAATGREQSRTSWR